MPTRSAISFCSRLVNKRIRPAGAYLREHTWKRKTRRARDGLCTDCPDYLSTLPFPPQRRTKTPFERVKYVRDGTASRDNSELCLSSSLGRPALPPNRASSLLSTSRGTLGVPLAILPRFPDSFSEAFSTLNAQSTRLGSIRF